MFDPRISLFIDDANYIGDNNVDGIKPKSVSGTHTEWETSKRRIGRSTKHCRSLRQRHSERG